MDSHVIERQPYLFCRELQRGIGTGGLAIFLSSTCPWVVMIVFAAAGLLAHSAYLWQRVWHAPRRQRGAVWRLGTIGALWRPGCWPRPILWRSVSVLENSVGLVLVSTGFGADWCGISGSRMPPFARTGSWLLGHVPCGFMLLWVRWPPRSVLLPESCTWPQSYRLKQKLLPRPGLRLPSLEWLQQLNRRSLLLFTGFLALGLARRA